MNPPANVTPAAATAAAAPQTAPATASHDPLIVVAVPVHDEQQDLEHSVRILHEYLRVHVPYRTELLIVDNASTDATWAIARSLTSLPDVHAVHLDAKGRGRALQTAWGDWTDRADVLAYMDVDLSTDLQAFGPLIEPLLSGEADLAIGTRLAPASRVTRGFKREFISRCYNLLLHGALHVRFSDAQCGFKAITAEAARTLLPQVQDTQFFFDTELLVKAERSGMRIHEVPVAWVDDRDSRVNIPQTVRQDLAGIMRVGAELSHSESHSGSHPHGDAAAGGSGAPDDPTTPSASGSAPARRPTWERLGLAGLLALTAISYAWNLQASGWANAFYTAAVQAGSENWTAFLFGSSDMGNSITVDKPPAFLWLMALSVRIFGLNSWAMLLPQVALGVATIWLLWLTVRRVSTPLAAFVAAGALATTPVAAMMFRYNNPDAMLVFLLTLTAWLVVRAIDDGRTRWMLLAGATIGLGFLTKQLQAFLVLPGFALVYIFAAPHGIWRRLRNGLLAIGALIVSAGWWVAVVELVPESWRPFVGGSQSDSFLELTFGYNGFGRITGDETGSVGGGAPGGMWGATGISRLFDGEFGGQAAWLIPAALILLAALIWVTWRRPRTDPLRAQALLWGSWLIVTGLVFSFMSGIFHAYYTVALTPAIAALVGLGVGELWRRVAAADATAEDSSTRLAIRSRRIAAPTLALATAVTAVWSFVLLTRSDSALRWPVLVIGLIAALALAAVPWLGADGQSQRWGLVAGGAALTVALSGPLSYTVYTLQRGYTGSIVTAGPSVRTTTGFGAFPGGGFPNAGTGMPRGGAASGADDTGASEARDGGTSRGNGATALGGGGGLLGGTEVSPQLVSLLQRASGRRWAAATIGSQNAASYQLESGLSVMPIGGFNGTDPSPTLEQFQRYVSDGEIGFYISGRQMGQARGGSEAASEITAWVEANFPAETVGGVTIYVLAD